MQVGWVGAHILNYARIRAVILCSLSMIYVVKSSQVSLSTPETVDSNSANAASVTSSAPLNTSYILNSTQSPEANDPSTSTASTGNAADNFRNTSGTSNSAQLTVGVDLDEPKSTGPNSTYATGTNSPSYLGAALPAAQKPTLGWSSSQPFACEVSSAVMKQQASFLSAKGLKAIGYKMVLLDCSWDDGRKLSEDLEDLLADIKSFKSFLKGQGLGFGLKMTGGRDVCSVPAPHHHHHRWFHWFTKRASYTQGLDTQRPMSQKLEKRGNDDKHNSDDDDEDDDDNPQYKNSTQDATYNSGKLSPTAGAQVAETYSEALKKILPWKIDYLKFRPCASVPVGYFENTDYANDLNEHYTAMGNAIRNSGQDIIYSTGQWGVTSDDKNKTANSWRVTAKMHPDWHSIWNTVNSLVPEAKKAGPGGFNDLGLLQIGEKGLSHAEQNTQLVFWAASKSPLFISTNLQKIDETSLEMLKNRAPIEVNQDVLGQSITFKRRYTGVKDVWSGPLSDGSEVAVVINWDSSTKNVTLDIQDLGLSSAHVYDLWSGKDLGVTNSTVSQHVGGHANLFLKLNETKPAPEKLWNDYPISDKNKAHLMGLTTTRTILGNITVACQIASNDDGAVQWVDIDGGEKGGTILVSIDYINAEFNPTSQDCPSCRSAHIQVNEAEKIRVEFPLSGNNWHTIFKGFLVELPGFKPGEQNKVTLSGEGGFAPDIVSLSVLSTRAPTSPEESTL